MPHDKSQKLLALLQLLAMREFTLLSVVYQIQLIKTTPENQIIQTNFHVESYQVHQPADPMENSRILTSPLGSPARSYKLFGLNAKRSQLNNQHV